jgi:hypothetical protein
MFLSWGWGVARFIALLGDCFLKKLIAKITHSLIGV